MFADTDSDRFTPVKWWNVVKNKTQASVGEKTADFCAVIGRTCSLAAARLQLRVFMAFYATHFGHRLGAAEAEKLVKCHQLQTTKEDGLVVLAGVCGRLPQPTEMVPYITCCHSHFVGKY